jgi:hypothetical protein
LNGGQFLRKFGQFFRHPTFFCLLSAANLPADAATILGNKIKSLNHVPQSEVTDDLLAQLGLVFGEREKKAAGSYETSRPTARTMKWTSNGFAISSFFAFDFTVWSSQ